MLTERAPLGIRTDRRIGRVKGQDEIRDCPEPFPDLERGAGPGLFAHRSRLAALGLADDAATVAAVLD